MSLGDLYQDVILDHARRRVGRGEVDEFAVTHHEVNPTCGDEVTVGVDVRDGRIAGFAWSGQGCSISTASASVLSELLGESADAGGMDVADAHRLIAAFRDMMRSRGEGDVDEDLLGDGIAFQGVSRFVMRVKCAMLPWVALEACLPR